MSVSKPELRGSSQRSPVGRREPFESALGNFVAAIARRKIEPICVSYVALRRASGKRSTRELLDRLETSVGREGLALLISAFSHRRCYMCARGVNPCRTCEGSGRSADGGACLQCDGLAVEACDFCGGSGLSDAAVIPEEFRLRACEQRLARVDRQIHQLFRMPLPAEVRNARLDPAQRAELAGWLIRILGRVADLTALTSGNGHTERFESATRRARAMLEAIAG
jgi:hypothetical protein